MRGRSEHDPSMIRPWSEHETVSPQPASQPRLLFELATSIFYRKIQRFAPNLTFKHSPSAAPATTSDTWTSPSAAPATKSDTWTSPNAAPATKSDSYAWSSSHMKPHLQCAEQQMSPSNLHQILRLPQKITLQHFRENFRKRIKRHFQCGDDPSMIRAWSDHDPSMKPSVRSPPRNRGYFSSLPRAFSIEKYMSRPMPILHSNIHQMLRLPRQVTLELHQVLHLPRNVTLELHQVLRLPQKLTLELRHVLRLPQKVTLELYQVLHLPRKVTPILDPRHIWKLIYNARSNRCHPPTSPNTAPGTKNNTATFQRKLPKTDQTSSSMIRAWKTVSPQPASQPRLLFELTISIFYCKIQRFAPNLTFQHSPSTAPATKSDTWTSPSTAPATKSDTWTSPSIAPATKNWHLNFTKYCTCHEKWHLNMTKYGTCHEMWRLNFTKYCACHEMWHLNLTKYCACHEKWHLNSLHTTLTSRLLLHTALTSHDSYFTLFTLLLITWHDSYFTNLTSHCSYLTRLLLHTTLTSHCSYLTRLLLHTALTSHDSYFTTLTSHCSYLTRLLLHTVHTALTPHDSYFTLL